MVNTYWYLLSPVERLNIQIDLEYIFYLWCTPSYDEILNSGSELTTFKNHIHDVDVNGSISYEFTEENTESVSIVARRQTKA